MRDKDVETVPSALVPAPLIYVFGGLDSSVGWVPCIVFEGTRFEPHAGQLGLCKHYVTGYSEMIYYCGQGFKVKHKLSSFPSPHMIYNLSSGVKLLMTNINSCEFFVLQRSPNWFCGDLIFSGFFLILHEIHVKIKF